MDETTSNDDRFLNCLEVYLKEKCRFFLIFLESCVFFSLLVKVVILRGFFSGHHSNHSYEQHIDERACKKSQKSIQIDWGLD